MPEVILPPKIKNNNNMETLFERISRWMANGEWTTIKEVFTSSATLERYYNIVAFVEAHKKDYGHVYREKILDNEKFKNLFGHLDLEYLKKAIFTMHKKYPKHT